MNTFKKYEFTPTQWETLKKKIQQTDDEGNKSYVGCAVHEIGQICHAYDEEGNCTDLSPKWAVDILWYVEPLADFAPYEVFPSPVGVHTFSGCDNLYLQGYCAKFPDSEYCVVPDAEE